MIGFRRRTLSRVLVCIMIFTSILPVQIFAEESIVTFSRDEGGKPNFDGVPAHLDAFVDLILSDMSNEDLAYYADQKAAGNPRKVKAGYTLPGTAAGGVDRVMGVSTDMPSMTALGQSWNKGLVNQVGTIIGDERRGEVELSDPNTLMFSAVADMRTNPLSGRFDEGYSEDPVLAGTLINSMAEGITGYGEQNNEDGFWLKVQLGTKHFTNYLAQWFRINGQFEASSRALNEYQMKSFLQPLNKGLVVSLMTTYGRTNGIPNHISPNIIRADNESPYTLMPVGDFINADAQMVGGFNNGYENYTDAEGKAALLLLSGNHANDFTPNVSAILNAVNKGIFGVTRKELEDSVRGQIEMWVRTGYFGGGNYPFSHLAKVGRDSPASYTSAESQAVALDAARESVVLLKNENGILPLSKESKVAVTGPLADSRFKATYSVGITPDIEDSGMSPLGAIQKAIGEEQVTYGTGAKIVAFESKAFDGVPVTASQDVNGAQLTVTTGSIIVINSETTTGSIFTVGDKTYPQNQSFEVYAWGQEGYSYKSLANNKWLRYTEAGRGPWGQPQENLRTDLALMNNDNTSLNMTQNEFSNVSDGTTLPGRLRKEVNADGTITLLGETYSESFLGGFETVYYTSGRFVTVNENGGVQLSTQKLSNVNGAKSRTESEKFQEITLKATGADAAVWKTDNDYAVVVVGAPTRHSAGEGADRSSLDLGQEQYELIENVAAEFQGKTIVIIKSNFPVSMEEIQNNSNVAAILYQPYAGQYDSKALADVLFGDYAPTGRLTSTWYATIEALPKLDQYSLPQGAAPNTLEEIDPRFIADMTNGDPAETELTYMYTNADVTYAFGYGLGYSHFSFSNLTMPGTVSGSELFNVKVNVSNTGSVDTAEVVQLYIKNNTSAYGKYVPKKQLIAYEKVNISAGQTQTVTLAVDPKGFAIWDVNSRKFINESGTYTLMAGKASDNILLEGTMNYTGESLAKLDATVKSVNVFDAAFASDQVVYREVSKLRTAEGLKNDASEYGYYAVMSKGKDSWVALNQVNLEGVKSITLRGASEKAVSVVEIYTGSPTGKRLAVITLDRTSAVNRDVPGDTDKTVRELDYIEVTEDLLQSVLGYNDVYLVFRTADTRVDSIQFNSGAASQLVVTTENLLGGTENTNYNQPLASAGGTAPFTWTVTGLPIGLTFNEHTGLISGTPKEAGTYQVKVFLEDSEGVIIEKIYTLTINKKSSEEGSGSSGGGGGSSNNSTVTPPVAVTPSETIKTKEVIQVNISLASGKASNTAGSFELSVKPYIQEGRTMIGIRDIATLLNVDSKNIIWEAKDKSIVIKASDKEIRFVIGQNYASVNGEKIALDVPAQIKAGRAVLPVAHIARILGIKVEFDVNTKEVRLFIEK